MTPYSHCHYCGTRYASDHWPRVCGSCAKLTYRNPLPVVVVLQPVDDGLLLIRRGIEPCQGQLALPGGYMDYNESFAEAAGRELSEETGYQANTERMQVFDVASAHNNTLLLFVLAEPITAAELPPWTPNHEVTEIVLAREAQPLAFRLHTHAMARFFAQRAAAE